MENKFKLNQVLYNFINIISTVQSRQNSKIFSTYNGIYNKLFEKLFRLSSVSIIFRLFIDKENLYKNILDRHKKDHIDDRIESKINENNLTFQNRFNEMIKKMHSNSSLKYNDNVAFDIKELQNILLLMKEEEKNFLDNSNSDNHNINNSNKIDKEISNLKGLQCEYFNEICQSLNIEILLVKRASSQRDKYSGNIAFPGGKFEKEDRNTYNTSIRETFEEIGINFNMMNNFNDKDITNTNNNILGLYLCPNMGFDLTMDMRNFVTSHIFLVVDINKELEKSLLLSKNEIAEVLFIPLKFFFELNNNLEENHNKNSIKDKVYTYVNGNVSGKKCKIKKVVLQNNINFSLFGMTLRKIISLLNINSKNVKYKEIIIFENFSYNLYFKIFLLILKFVSNSYNSYRIFKKTLALFSIYLFGKIIFTVITNIEKVNHKL